jgi:hypothetical protein
MTAQTPLQEEPHVRKLLIGVFALAAFATACGGDDDAATETTAAAGATETTAAAAETTEAATETTEAATETTTAAAGAGGAAAAAAEATLTEWAIAGPTSVKAGKVTITAKNGGSFPHELAVFKGSYADLPKSDIGAVLEDQLPAGGLIGRTDRIQAGGSAPLEVNLAAGQYSMICNISAGPNSHAGKGQVLDFTVS